MACPPSTASALLPPLVKRSPDGIGVLGFPLGTADFVAEFLLGKAMVTVSIVDRLLLLMLHHCCCESLLPLLWKAVTSLSRRPPPSQHCCWSWTLDVVGIRLPYETYIKKLYHLVL